MCFYIHEDAPPPFFLKQMENTTSEGKLWCSLELLGLREIMSERAHIEYMELHLSCQGPNL